MSNWYAFDRETPEERQRNAVLDQIAAAEKAALDACREISATVELHPGIAHQAGSAALLHIATIAGVGMNALGKRALERDELRRRKVAGER